MATTPSTPDQGMYSVDPLATQSDTQAPATQVAPSPSGKMPPQDSGQDTQSPQVQDQIQAQPLQSATPDRMVATSQPPQKAAPNPHASAIMSTA
jgi:hypothetical protein